MKKYCNNKKMLSILLIFVMILGLTSCNFDKNVKIGSGQPGKIASFDWSAYDKLIDECKRENNQEKRNKKMYEAENMLLDTGTIIPLYGLENKYLCRENVDNFFISSGGVPTVKYSKLKDGKKELNVCICTEPGSFDPAQTTTIDTATLVENYTGRLFQANENGYEEELAESLDVSKDGKTYIIKIKDDAKWSDGVDVKAKDFVYTWKRAADPKNAAEYGFMFDPIELVDKKSKDTTKKSKKKESNDEKELNVKALDDKTLKIKLKMPCSYFKSLLGHACYSPIREDFVKAAKGYDKNIYAWATKEPTVSCGAFCVESWKHNSSIILKKNPRYIFADKIKIEKINLMLSSDASAAFSAYESGDIDIVFRYIPSDEVPNLEKRSDYYKKQSKAADQLYINVNSDIFRGMTAEEAKNFRKAIGYTVDREFMVKTVLVTQEVEEKRFVPKTIRDGTGNLFCESIKSMSGGKVNYGNRPDFDKARKMLKDIGFTFDKEGKIQQDISIEYAYNNSEKDTSVATCLQADFAELGIKLVTKSLDWNLFLNERRLGKFEIARGTWTADYDDPMTFLEMFTTNNDMNDVSLGKFEE